MKNADLALSFGETVIESIKLKCLKIQSAVKTQEFLTALVY